MDCVNIQYYKAPYGELVLGAYDNKLCLCDWRYRKLRATIDSRIMKGLKVVFVEKENEVLDKTKQQLEAYFFSERKQFDIPLLMIGSDFQQKVWNELLNVSYGTTSSYLKLADKIGNKNAVRAVANANGANAISIIIPCHRIVGSKGELVGYAGGLKTKEKLLQLENNLFSVHTSNMQYNIDF
jgi:methylated-DNA-[protein]-cysteine S-methyltransferase